MMRSLVPRDTGFRRNNCRSHKWDLSTKLSELQSHKGWDYIFIFTNP